jgi:hypothetical protein
MIFQFFEFRSLELICYLACLREGRLRAEALRWRRPASAKAGAWSLTLNILFCFPFGQNLKWQPPNEGRISTSPLIKTSGFNGADLW